MNAHVKTCARIAKIRAIERRIAELGLARADRDLRHIEGIVARLKALTSDLGAADFIPTGASFAARSELKLRLDRAARATLKPLAEATNRRVEKHSGAVTAHLKSGGAQTVLQRTLATVAKADEHRANANRITRRPARVESDAS